MIKKSHFVAAFLIAVIVISFGYSLDTLRNYSNNQVAQVVTSTSTSFLSSLNFEDGTFGTFTNPWGYGISVVDDPTGAGKGKIGKFVYYSGADGSPAPSASDDHALITNTEGPFPLGKSIWLHGDLYFKTGTGGYSTSDNRKIIRLSNDSRENNTDIILHKVDGGDLRLTTDIYRSGSVTAPSGSTGIQILNDRWYTLDVELVPNSARGVNDGKIRIYINGATIPTYERAVDIDWNTDPTNTTSAGKPYFRFGDQLTIALGHPTYEDVRYWDNLAVSSSRIGSSVSVTPTPTPTPEPSPTPTPEPTPTPTPDPVVTNPNPTGAFSLNSWVATTEKLNIRSTPGGQRLGSQGIGSKGTVVSGPVSQGGYNWWNINFASGADGYGVETYLTSTTAPIPLAINSSVTTTESLKVRSLPTTTGAYLGVQKSGSTGTITAGPTQANGYTWWNVNFTSGPDGWVVDSLR